MKTKSYLGIKEDLVSQGWEFLTNVDPKVEVKYSGGYNYHTRGVPKSDNEIVEEYLSRGFKEVLVTDAFDAHGRPVEELRAVYVKR